MGKFLDFLFEGLKNSDSGLGDRSKYVGASDIGQCLRKSYLSKTQKQEFSLEQLLIFERGHVGEGIILKALKAKNLTHKEQIELKGCNDEDFIITHLDAVVADATKRVVIECKTTTTLPDSPRESWIHQTQVQLKLLKDQNPDKEVRGYIIGFNLNTGEAKEWEVSFNEALYSLAIDRAKTLWKAMEDKVEPYGEVGDLCAYCSFKGDCPALRAGGSELSVEIAEMVEKAKKLSSLEKELKTLKDEIKNHMESSGMKKGLAGEYTVSLANYKGRETIDSTRLKEDHPDIYAQYVNFGQGYSVLKIS